MTVAATHAIKAAPVLAGSRRKNAPGGVRATRLDQTMLDNAQTTIKRIAEPAARRLLGLRAGADPATTTGLLGFTLIARRRKGGVIPQIRIKSYISRRHARYVGEYGSDRDSQDKRFESLAAYLPLDCLDQGVLA